MGAERKDTMSDPTEKPPKPSKSGSETRQRKKQIFFRVTDTERT